jgi:hypothetical protein
VVFHPAFSHDPLVNGVPWFDDRGETVNAHGACLIEADGRVYLFGEYKTDDLNVFAGFSCYSSDDLVNWRFERMAVADGEEGLLGPGRIGERPKVMQSPSTGQYVMFMHTDSGDYTDPCIGVATSDRIDGEFKLVGALEYKGEPIRRWDVGTFQDDDGTGYLLLHEGDIYRLSEDFLSAEELVASQVARGGESPAIAKLGGTYHLMLSNKTSWESNDNFYLTATALTGPWTFRGPFAPGGTQTWNSQCTFAFNFGSTEGPVHMYMGDRWSFPHQKSAATYVWLPIDATEDGLLLPSSFIPVWSPHEGRPSDLDGTEESLDFRSGTAGESLTVPFDGSRIAIKGWAKPDGAYANVELLDDSGRTISSVLVTFYAKVANFGYRYVSPRLSPGTYALKITVEGVPPVWSDKSGTRYGSVGTWVDVRSAVVAT